MERREAVVCIFTIQEVAEALGAYAKKLQQNLPEKVEDFKIEIDPQKRVVNCTFIGSTNLVTVGNA